VQTVSVVHSVQTKYRADSGPIQWIQGAFSPGGGGVKRQGREANDSSSSSAAVKGGGAIPPLPNISSWRSV
jgi:hypothetical protein